MKKEVVTFRKSMGAGTSGTITERLKDDGFIEEVRIRFYPGVERQLQVSPFILHKENRREDLFTFPEGTEKYITGDNDYLIFPVSLEFAYDDEIQVSYVNTDINYPYTLVVDIVVSYQGV